MILYIRIRRGNPEQRRRQQQCNPAKNDILYYSKVKHNRKVEIKVFFILELI